MSEDAKRLVVKAAEAKATIACANEHFALYLTSLRLDKREWQQVHDYILELEHELERVRNVGIRIAAEKFELKGELRALQPVSPLHE